MLRTRPNFGSIGCDVYERGGRVAVRAGGGTCRRKAPLVAATVDFQTAPHIGYARSLSRIIGGEAADYTGMVIGCAVHWKLFLLGSCGNSVNDRFFQDMVHLRDVDVEVSEADTCERLSSLAVGCLTAQDATKSNVIP